MPCLLLSFYGRIVCSCLDDFGDHPSAYLLFLVPAISNTVDHWRSVVLFVRPESPELIHHKQPFVDSASVGLHRERTHFIVRQDRFRGTTCGKYKQPSGQTLHYDRPIRAGRISRFELAALQVRPLCIRLCKLCRKSNVSLLPSHIHDTGCDDILGIQILSESSHHARLRSVCRDWLGAGCWM